MSLVGFYVVFANDIYTYLFHVYWQAHLDASSAS